LQINHPRRAAATSGGNFVTVATIIDVTDITDEAALVTNGNLIAA